MSKRKYRASWNLAGLKGPDHVVKYGETIELTDEEAAPYVGNVLSPADAPAPASTEPTSDASTTAPAAKGRGKGKGKEKTEPAAPPAATE
jgi:hypothetical protein